MIRLVSLVLLFLSSIAIGCTGSESSAERLQLSVMMYNQALRWGNIGDAASYIPDDKREEWTKRRRRLEETVVILDYDLVEVRHPDAAAPKADVTVSFEWRGKSSNVVETGKFVQEWTYRDVDKRWFMIKQTEIKKEEPLDEDTPIRENL